MPLTHITPPLGPMTEKIRKIKRRNSKKAQPSKPAAAIWTEDRMDVGLEWIHPCFLLSYCFGTYGNHDHLGGGNWETGNIYRFFV